MAEMDPGKLAASANPYPVTDPEKIPVQRYFDPDFYQAEVDHLWPHAWQMACRLELIPNVGDWVEYANLGTSVIVVRTRDGVKAHHNHCRHRGVPIAGGHGTDNGGGDHGNCAKTGFICPFHGWRWDMDGKCTFVYGKHLFSDNLMDQQELALRPVRAETWGGCAFINLDADAPSLRESLGPVLQRLEAHGIDDLRVEWWCGTVLPANWKIAMEAFQEGYHVMKTHPQLPEAMGAMYNSLYGPGHKGSGSGVVQPLDYKGVTSKQIVEAQIRHLERLSEGMAGMCQQKEVDIAKSLRDAELPEDPGAAMQTWWAMVQDKVSKELKARGENVPDLNAVCASDPVHAVEFLFPHYFLLPFMTSFASYRIRPLGPESCLFEIWSLTHYPKGEEPEPPTQPTMLPYDSQDFPMIPRQDYSNIPIQQKGLHSPGFEFMRLSKEVEGLISNYHRIIDGYIAGAPGAKLAAANQKLGGNFDGKIQDLGL